MTETPTATTTDGPSNALRLTVAFAFPLLSLLIGVLGPQALVHQGVVSLTTGLLLAWAIGIASMLEVFPWVRSMVNGGEDG